MIRKRCRKCGEDKIRELCFRKDEHYADGFGAQCSTCVAETRRLWYQKNKARILEHYAGKKEERAETSRLWVARNREKARAYTRAYRARGKAQNSGQAEWAAFTRRLSNFGLTLDQYHAKAEQQNFQCAVCKEVPEVKKGTSADGYVIDHDHETGRVRGLLCNRCNVAAGMVRDSEVIASHLSTYLHKHNAKRQLPLAA